MNSASTSSYGHFDDATREYVITRPDTPLPWLNYLGQDEFFGLCTNTAGGYTFWKDAKLRRLTRYRYNNVPYDLGGRYFYVNDGGEVWNPGWKPVKAKGVKYECRHGLGYSRIIGERDGLEVEALFFVPPGENLEVWKLTVRNKSAQRKTPKLFSYQEFCFFEALNDMTNYQRTYSIGEVEVEGSAIYHKTEFRERRNHYTLFACTRPIAGFDTSRDAFVGIHEGLHEAKVPFAGQATNSVAFGWNPIGSHQVDLDLTPGAEESFAFVLAYVEQGDAPKFDAPFVMNKSVGRAIVEKYSAPGAVDAAFAGLKKYWDDLLGNFQVDCPNEHAQRMANTWNQYQCMATFNMSRSASMYETGIGRGMGFRDSNQDLLGFVHMIPSRARERILDIAATQLSDGTCFHQYQPLTKKGNADIGGDFYDDHLWLVLSTCAYIKESGDVSILQAPCGYADKEYENVAKETLLHHLETAIAYTMKKRGPNGLPLIGHADWNDCLNLNCFSTEPNESFQTAGDVRDSKAESVMIAGLFLYAAREMAALYEHLDRNTDAARMRGHYTEMLDTVERVAWDGAWYTRAYAADGSVVGSHSNEEGKIFIESQGWCVLGGAGADNGRARQAMESVHQHLYTKNGVVLQQPAYSSYDKALGEVTSYPPGVKENAGIFSHNNTWIHLAWCLLGEGDRALEYYLSICPSAKQDQIDTYRGEPYVYAQMIAGKDAPCFGEAKNNWLTGTAAWTFVVVSQGLLGIQPDYAGLRIDPCIPKDWPGFTVTRRFRGDTFEIRVSNPDQVSKGVKAVRVDGKDVDPKRAIAPVGDGRTHQVEIVLGA
ncbi:GH36-type glycosyl hydrolase domain-containing protein [Niveibacterium sp.]|uniref:GH36-type glycosyl hydrolase domain-containing protein n=1 Tax=Niveibacterium sp. TaxID=2017444 RepID=UPI0035B21EBF